jgi:hypothetical protein
VNRYIDSPASSLAIKMIVWSDFCGRVFYPNLLLREAKILVRYDCNNGPVERTLRSDRGSSFPSQANTTMKKETPVAAFL